MRLKDRLRQLEKDVETSKEKVAKLQMEKEKAMSDLIAIRKISKERGRLVDPLILHLLKGSLSI